MIAVRGVFDVPRISSFIKTLNPDAISSYQGIDIISPDVAGGVAFLDSTIAILGEPPSVKNAIDRRRTGRKAKDSTIASIQDISARNDIWFVSTTPFAEGPKPVAQPAPGTPGFGPLEGMMSSDAFKSIQQMAGGIRFDTDTVTISLEAVTRSDKDATAMADVARFLTSMMQMNRDKPEMAAAAAMLDAIQLRTDGPKFKLSINIPQADIEKMIDSQQKQPARRAAR